MVIDARGTFEVKIIPQSPNERPEASAIGRMLIDKTFHGDLKGPVRAGCWLSVQM
jgi:hypothetical protein